MLTIRILVRTKTCLFLGVAVLLGGCMPPGPKALIEGKRLLDQGRYAPAIEKLKVATSLLASNALAWNYLGLASHHAGLLPEAERAYQRALYYDRDLTEAHYNLGCLWLEENKPDGARLQLTAFTLRRANSLQGLLKLGTAQLRLRDPNGAERTFEEALQLSPQHVEALNGLGLARAQRGRFSEAAGRFNEALKVQPGYPPAVLNLAIISQVYLRDRSSAVQRYREYLELQPPPPNAQGVAATLHQLEAEMNPVVHPPVASPVVPVVVAEANASPSRHPAPIPAPSPTNSSRTIASPKPDSTTNTVKPTVMVPAAKSLPVAGVPVAPLVIPKPTPVVAPKPAPQPTQQPVPRSPSSLPITIPVTPAPTQVVVTPAPVLAVATPPVTTPAPAVVPTRSPSPPPNAPVAAPQLDSPPPPARAAPGSRSEAQLALARGEAAQEAHHLDEAIREYESAIELDPSFFEAQYNLGIAATQAGRISRALSAYEAALLTRPESANARYNLALVLKQANFPADAVKQLGKLLEQYPEESRAHLALANLYARTLNQPEKARPHYQRVLEIDPHDPMAANIRDWLKANPR